VPSLSPAPRPGWCNRKTSSTKYSFVEYLNKLPLAVNGIVFFETPVTFGRVSAFLLGFLSDLVYGYGRMWQKDYLPSLSGEKRRSTTTGKTSNSTPLNGLFGIVIT